LNAFLHVPGLFCPRPNNLILNSLVHLLHEFRVLRYALMLHLLSRSPKLVNPFVLFDLVLMGMLDLLDFVGFQLQQPFSFTFLSLSFGFHG
jgi:hypothetical protein